MSAAKKKSARKPRAPKPGAPVESSAYAVPTGRALMLRTCDAQMRAYGGFLWPTSGLVECPDWSPRPHCGHGLHGLLWGEGDVTTLTFEDPTRRWMVCEVESAEVVQIDRKVKVPRAWVVLVGTRDEAVALIAQHAPVGTRVVFGTATAGDAGTATAGTRGTATAGTRGTATAGDAGTATAGDAGTATAGDAGTATAGTRGTATAGTRGTATAGYAGTATAGEYGCLCIEWWDEKRSVYRKLVAEVDGERIKAGVAYVVKDGAFVEKASVA